MGGRQRENDVVFGRGGLKLEVELAAEAFPKGEAPGAIDAASVGRMDHELHAARLIEKSFQNDGFESGQGRQRGARCRQVVHDLSCGGLCKACLGDKPAKRLFPSRILIEPRFQLTAETRHGL